MAGTITWTKTDESPALTSVSLLPIIEHFLAAADIKVEQLDISFSGRILQEFHDYLTPEQQLSDAMIELKELVERPEANIIKLPNASATDNQLKDAVKELQGKGFALPDYPETPASEEEKAIRARYDKLTGSIVNPVLRQGNAVRSIPAAVKEAARANPHALGEWKTDSRTRVATMNSGDFFATEQSLTAEPFEAGPVAIEFINEDGEITTLGHFEIQEKDIIDTAVMQRGALQDFLQEAIAVAAEEDLLLSLHLKATMLKKTDGVVFGEALKQYFKPVFALHGDILDRLGFDPQSGMDELLAKIETLPQADQDRIKKTIEACLNEGPELAMVNAKTGTHHLSSPNGVIVDISMANLARWGGEVQARDGRFGDTLAVIPDSTYAAMHQYGIDFLKANGSPDVKTMGSVTTVRLQADGAEEYGSKNTTFIAPDYGIIRLVQENGEVVNEQAVAEGDIWRLCRTSDRAIQNWLDLAADYARNSGERTIFWLDKNRPHDYEIIQKISKREDLQDLAAPIILSPADAMHVTLERSYNGEDTICVTGNLAGDHITDYFPILEIGSSAKMLSVIKLLGGGIVAETGSGGTAPLLVGMFEENGHFLWDDTGTAMALSESLRHLSAQCQNVKAEILADTLEAATQRYINDNRAPAPNGLDGRQSHFYLAQYWAQELARQTQDAQLQSAFSTLSGKLSSIEKDVMDEIGAGKGKAVNLNGHYYLESPEVKDIMRPSASFTL